MRGESSLSLTHTHSHADRWKAEHKKHKFTSRSRRSRKNNTHTPKGDGARQGRQNEKKTKWWKTNMRHKDNGQVDSNSSRSRTTHTHGDILWVFSAQAQGGGGSAGAVAELNLDELRFGWFPSKQTTLATLDERVGEWEASRAAAANDIPVGCPYACWNLSGGGEGEVRPGTGSWEGVVLPKKKGCARQTDTSRSSSFGLQLLALCDRQTTVTTVSIRTHKLYTLSLQIISEIL